MYSIFFSWIARLKATFYLKNHFQTLFWEDYRQRMFKLMLHSSIIFAGRENGCGLDSIRVSASRKYNLVTSFVGRNLTLLNWIPHQTQVPSSERLQIQVQTVQYRLYSTDCTMQTLISGWIYIKYQIKCLLETQWIT